MDKVVKEATREITQGERFAFGENWRRFLATLNDDRIASAQASLEKLFGVGAIAGKSVLDVGSGSGLFSMSAMNLGARRVHSFDYDPQSVACGRELRSRFYPDSDRWVIEPGSILDADYLQGLGTFDVVYSWGVLHHTGQLWAALDNIGQLVAPGGTLCVAIYNKQGVMSRYWLAVKKLYNRLPGPLKALMGWGYYAFFAVGLAIADLARGRNPAERHAGTKRRGMSFYHDVVDWIGGYPFEVASPEEIFLFFKARGFQLENLKTCAGKHGCNEFVFKKA